MFDDPLVICRGSPRGRGSRIERSAEMTVELNHTIIPAKDKCTSAKFLTDILNLEAGPEWGPLRTGQDQ